ncbi:sensor histidine kinase [Nakamurella panacisegetis]
MIIGVSGLAVALTAGSITLYVVLSVSVNQTLDSEARSAADEVAVLVDRGSPPDPLPVAGAQVVQIVDQQGRVVDGSATADRLTPLLHPDELRSALAGHAIQIPGSRIALSGPLRVVARTAGPASAPVTVLAAQPIGDLRHTASVLRTALLISAPLLLGLLALIAWMVIGRTLRPVEALRRGAERISGSGRTERLPVPHSTDEIAALAVTLNQMLDRLALARDRQRAFVADAAHELRSPLASITLQLEVAQRLGDGGQVLEDLRVDVDRLSVLIEDLLLLARADADSRRPAAMRTFDVGALAAQVADSAGGHARVSVRADTDQGCSIKADPEEIRRAVGNLVANAVRHARSAVSVRVRRVGSNVQVDVIDDGSGIPPADRTRVFDRFTRLDDARDRDAGGSGLGLSIVADIVRRAGGTVVLLDREPDDGLPDPADGPRTGLLARLVLPAAPPS